MISLAIIGTGSIAPHYLQAIEWLNRHEKFDIRVVAAVNRTEESNDKARQILGIPRTYTNITDMLTVEKLDGILVTVPAQSIFEVTRDLIPYRIPLLIEKPPGVTSEQTRQLATLSEQHGTNVMVGFNRRFYSLVRQAKELIAQSGALLGIRMDVFERYRWLREQNWFDPRKLELLFTTNSIHCIDLIRYYTGEVKEISIFRNTEILEPYNHRYAALIVSETNIPVTFQAYWHSYGNWNYELYIPDGKIQFINLEEAYIHIRNKEPYRLQPDEPDIGAKPGFATQLSYFVEHVVSADRYRGRMSIEDAVKSVELMERLRNG